MEIVSHEDISAAVLRGMRLNTDRYLHLIQTLVPRPLRRVATAFAGVTGSPIYNELESGQMGYFRYVLKSRRIPPPCTESRAAPLRR